MLPLLPVSGAAPKNLTIMGAFPVGSLDLRRSLPRLPHVDRPARYPGHSLLLYGGESHGLASASLRGPTVEAVLLWPGEWGVQVNLHRPAARWERRGESIAPKAGHVRLT